MMRGIHKSFPGVQALENVICFVFLKWYFAPFAAKHEDSKVLDIVQKTARKMSEEGRARVLAEFDLPKQGRQRSVISEVLAVKPLPDLVEGWQAPGR